MVCWRFIVVLFLCVACSTGESLNEGRDLIEDTGQDIQIRVDLPGTDLGTMDDVLDSSEDEATETVERDVEVPEPELVVSDSGVVSDIDGGPLDEGAEPEEAFEMPVMVTIESGSFVMGSPVGEQGQDASEELPQHSVTLTQAFEVQSTEVTQYEWLFLMGNNPSRFTGCGEQCPVEQVSWWDALAYCNALSDQAGYDPCYQLVGCSGVAGEGLQCGGVVFLGLQCEGFRLPTEAEWEYVARAGSQGPIYTGDVSINGYCYAPELAAIAWFCGNSEASYEGASECPSFPELPAEGTCGIHPVGQKPPTSWGVYDILGNVGEWTWDRFGETYYQLSPELDPLGPFTGSRQVARGCSWRNGAGDCRAAARGDFEPSAAWDFLGFRPVRTLP